MAYIMKCGRISVCKLRRIMKRMSKNGIMSFESVSCDRTGHQWNVLFMRLVDWKSMSTVSSWERRTFIFHSWLVVI